MARHAALTAPQAAPTPGPTRRLRIRNDESLRHLHEKNCLVEVTELVNESRHCRPAEQSRPDNGDSAAGLTPAGVLGPGRGGSLASLE
jgi:hypothetical protein